MKSLNTHVLRTLRAGLFACFFVSSAVSSTRAADTIFSFTGGNQTYTVPNGITTVRVRLWGGGGLAPAGPNSPDGGGGAFVTGLLSVTPGETLTVVVGSGGSNGSVFGGGASGAFANVPASQAGGGGGRSAIQRAGSDVVTAGGGGGAAHAADTRGGAGGLSLGGDGGGGALRGQGGTQAGGGAGGVDNLGMGGSGSNGVPGAGGGGGLIPTGYGGGGGGGGFHGGGGGAGNALGAGGGGGGSSLLTSLTDSGGSQAGTNRTPGGTTDLFYVAGIGAGAQGSTNGVAGNGRVVIQTITDPEPGLIVRQRGDPVPGAGGDVIPEGADFISFGVPAISDTGAVSYLASWVSDSGKGTGIFADSNIVVTAVGRPVPGVAEARFKSFKDPVAGQGTTVAFLATIQGKGVNASNDGVVAMTAGDAGLVIVAREGSQAANAPEGAVWKSFTSLAMSTGGDFGPIFLGSLAPGRGSVTARNDGGLWAVDSTGELRLMLREGDEVGGKTVKFFTVLKAVAGSPGQTRAFNDSGAIVAQAIFTDGTSAILRLGIP